MMMLPDILMFCNAALLLGAIIIDVIIDAIIDAGDIICQRQPCAFQRPR